MNRKETEQNVGHYINTPAGLQLLAGYQLNVLKQDDKLIVYHDSLVLICWSRDGGVYHHDAIDCFMKF